MQSEIKPVQSSFNDSDFDLSSIIEIIANSTIIPKGTNKKKRIDQQNGKRLKKNNSSFFKKNADKRTKARNKFSTK